MTYLPLFDWLLGIRSTFSAQIWALYPSSDLLLMCNSFVWARSVYLWSWGRMFEAFLAVFCSRLIMILWFSRLDVTLWPPGCQGARGGTMAAGATVGESQLQRIIRDLHGTSVLCVCAWLCVWLVAGSCWLKGGERIVTRDVISQLLSKYSLYTWNCVTSLCIRITWEGKRMTSCSCKGVTKATVSMQRERESMLTVHPSQVSFQFLRWIRGKFSMYRMAALKEEAVGKVEMSCSFCLQV